MKTLGFIGLGIMGKPMVRNLLRHGYDVVVYDIVPSAVQKMVGEGARSVPTPACVAAECPVIITMLPDSPQVQEVVEGSDGVLAGAREGLILLDMSSISPIASRKIAASCKIRGVTYLDCPVSGGEPKAVDGTLSIMCGGPEKVFVDVREILLCMGGTATLVGDVGSGNTTKLANQIIVGINIAALGEAMTLAVKMGTDPKLVFDAIRKGLAGSTVMESKMPMILDRRFDPGFRIALHIKDLNNTVNAAIENGISLPLTEQVLFEMKALQEDGMESLDHSALVRYCEMINNVIITSPK